jgi:hypothetical protein
MDMVAPPGDLVTLPSFTKEKGSSRHLEHVQTVYVVSEQWVTHLMWLPWIREGMDECERHFRLKIAVGRLTTNILIGTALLVYCTLGGAVGLVKVSRTWSTRAGACKPALATRTNHLDSSICEADDRIVTGLTFIEPWNMKVRPNKIHWNCTPENDSAHRGSSQVRHRSVME